MDHTLRIFLLGRVAFEVSGKPLAGLTAVKAQALLSYLAVTGRPHHRASLAGLLWSDVPETAAHNSLRVTLSQLRQAAGDYITVTRQTIALAPVPPIWLDVAHFAQACSRLQQNAVRLGESEYQDLRAAVHLYGGDFLAGFHVPNAELFEDWVVAERAHYSRLALKALTRLAEMALQRGAFAAGIEDARRALILDPLVEAVHRLLMRLYAYQGQAAQALRQYEECVRVLDEELGVPPDEETAALYDAIRTRTLALPTHTPSQEEYPSRLPHSVSGARPRHNLPHQTAPLVGRATELAALAELLAAPDQRLITIVAPGGMGKTRLAQEAALAQLDGFADGVYFVPLAPLSRVEELAPAIADAVNYRMQADARSPQEQLLDFLRGKAMLLVLDNFEHLLDGASLVTKILQSAGDVKLIVTARERLHLASETVFLLGGLPLPAGFAPGIDETSGAVQLFVQHAQRVAPEFTLTEANGPAVVQICRLTYGMPLGIVLASAWVSVLGTDEIAAEIAQSVDFLEADLRDLPPRQRSLACVFEHTWQRLSPAEQDVFMKLAAFRSGFDRYAAQVVAGATARQLLGLVDKALIQPSGPGRYQIHELLRQYGQRMLERAGIAHRAHDAHSRYFLHFLAAREADLKGRRQLPALAELEAELDNIRAAWHWALAYEDFSSLAQGVEALYLFFALRGHAHEGAHLLWRAYQGLHEETAHALRRQILVRYGLAQLKLYAWEDDIDTSLISARVEAEERGDQAEVGACWFALGRRAQIATCEGKLHTFDAALHYLGESLTCFRTLNDQFYIARTTELIGDCYGFDVSTMELFHAYYTVALDAARQAGSVVDEAHILGGLGWAAIDLGLFGDAERYYRQAVALSSHLPGADTVVYVKLGLAFVHFSEGSMSLAERLAEEGLSMAREYNATASESLALLILSLLAGMAGDYGKARQLAEQSRQTPSVRYFRSYTDWSLAVVHCSLGENERAWRYLRSSFQALRMPSSFARLLGVAAVLLGQQGERERATELLGAIFSDPHSARGWMEQWRPLTELRTRLQSELGAVAYQALWERGSKMDMKALAGELLGPVA